MILARRGCSSLARDIRTNSTVFGAILRRERSARILFEDDEVLAFRNIKPYAPLAGLVIPKRFVRQDPMGLVAQHRDMVLRLRAVGELIVAREQPAAAASRDYWLKFHQRGAHSVEHLHLHVVAPVSTIGKWDVIARFTDPKLACDVHEVLQRLDALQDEPHSGTRSDGVSEHQPTEQRGIDATCTRTTVPVSERAS